MNHLHLQERLQEFKKTASRPLLVIVGPTASGKTAISIDLALTSLATLGMTTEIVNADSRQLYKYLDIGTAKITKDEMQGVPHHLLDVLDPKQEATAAWYKREAERVIDEIHACGKLPMLVGGSMLYISAIIDGLEFPVGSDAVLRTRLEQEYDVDQGKTLYAKLADLDPETAAAFSQNNKPYVVRALEIYERTKSAPSRARQKSECPYDLFIIGIDRPREELMQRIDERTAELFKKGWVKEVRGLMQKGYGIEDPGMKSHGYREIMMKANGPIAEDKLTVEIAAKTRRYAKRQMTWWRGDSRIQWITRD